MAASWPPKDGLSSIIVPKGDATLTSFGSVRINAPASVVFEAVRNVAEYSKWNSFVPNVTILSQPESSSKESKLLEKDTSFVFQVVMDSSKPKQVTDVQLRVTDISTPEHPSDYVPQNVLEGDGSFTADLTTVYRISWKSEGSFISRGLKTERFHEVLKLEDNECEVRTWENQGGVLAHTVKWLYKSTLMKKFQDWCDDLKKACESNHVALLE
jgi:hypothetical protein